MEGNFWKFLFAILSGITAASIIAVVLSKNSQTVSVINSFSSFFNTALGTVTAPVSATTTSPPVTNDNTSFDPFAGNTMASAIGGGSNAGGGFDLGSAVQTGMQVVSMFSGL